MSKKGDFVIFWAVLYTATMDRTEQQIQRGAHSADHALIIFGAIGAAIDQYFKVRAGPSGVVCGELKESLPWPLHNLHKSG